MRSRVAGVLCAAAIAAAGTAVGCDRTRQAEAASSTAAERSAPADGAPAPAQPRTVAAVGGEPISRTLRLESHLLVERDVAVMARRDGFVGEIHADRGRRVKEGDPLATLEHGDLLLREKGAILELEKEQASYDRTARLHEQGIVPMEEFEQARLRRDAAEKELEQVRYEIGKCVIRAPFDGVVSGRFVEKGQVIKEDDARTLFQVTALGPLLARVYMPEWALFGVQEGSRALVTPRGLDQAGDDAGWAPIEAKVRWINHVIDAASGSAEMLVEITGGPGEPRLRPGMSVEVRIPLSYPGGTAGGGAPGRSLVSLPAEAIAPYPMSPGLRLDLKVLSKAGSVEARSVVLGFVGDDRVEIRHGLSAGDRVVVGSASPSVPPAGPSPASAPSPSVQ